jgi:hypothetical protein
MKLLGFLLLPAGWVIVIAALVLFKLPALRDLFVFAGIGIQVIGFALIFHRMSRRRELSR